MQLQIGGAHEWKTRVRYGLRRGEVPVVVEQWAVAHWPFFRVLLVPSFLASPQPRPCALSRSSFISIVLEYAQISPSCVIVSSYGQSIHEMQTTRPSVPRQLGAFGLFQRASYHQIEPARNSARSAARLDPQWTHSGSLFLRLY